MASTLPGPVESSGSEKVHLQTACPLDCPDACGIVAEVENNRVLSLTASDAHPLTDGFICGKVSHFAEHVHGEDRIRTPLRRINSKTSPGLGFEDFKPITWEEALSEIAGKMQRVKTDFGGEAILPYSYGGSNGFLTQGNADERLFRRLGASRLLRTACAVPTRRAVTGLYGLMPGVAYEDYVNASLIILWGVNPWATSIHFVPILKEARRRGAKLIVVDPRKHQAARQADLYLPIRPGTDLVCALAVHRWLIHHDRADLKFLADHASEWEEFKRRAEPWTLEKAAAVTGVSAASIEQLATMYASASPAVIRCGWGLERNRNGGSSAAAVLSLPAVAGKFGVRGGGFTMSNSVAWDFNSESMVNEAPAQTRAVNMNQLGDALLTLNDPPIKLLFVYNSNALDSAPAAEKVRKGLLRSDLLTVVFEQVMTGTARLADIILPATTFLEHEEFNRGYGAFVLQRSKPVIPPVGEARSNLQVFGELIARLGMEKSDDPKSEEELVNGLLASSKNGAKWGTSVAEDGIAKFSEKSLVQFVDIYPKTTDGKIHLVPKELDDEAPHGLYFYQEDPATERYPLALISPATGQTITTTLGQLWKAKVPVEISPADAIVRQIKSGDRVRIFSDLGEIICDAKVTEDVRAGVVVLPKGLWSHHTHNGCTSNSVSPDTLTDLGGGACYNDARVQIERVT